LFELQQEQRRIAEVQNAILERHTEQLEKHDQRFERIETLLVKLVDLFGQQQEQIERLEQAATETVSVLREIRDELRERTVHYGDAIALETTPSGMTVIHKVA
jgi:hypothetical protein